MRAQVSGRDFVTYEGPRGGFTDVEESSSSRRKSGERDLFCNRLIQELKSTSLYRFVGSCIDRGTGSIAGIVVSQSVQEGQLKGVQFRGILIILMASFNRICRGFHGGWNIPVDLNSIIRPL